MNCITYSKGSVLIDEGKPTEALESYRKALAIYEALVNKSLEIYQDMKSKGTLSGADAGKPDELAKEIAKCDANVR